MPPRPLAVKVVDAAFTPLTLAIELTAEVPVVVARAQREVRERVKVARWVGEMAVGYGRAALQRRFATPADQIGAE